MEPLSKRQLKIDFLRRNYKDLIKIDPMFDIYKVKCIMDDLKDAGFYTKKISEIDVGAVQSLILEAQGKKKKRRFIKKVDL